LANLLDTTSAADILAELPNRLHEVIVPHVAEKPKHPAFIEAGRVWTYRAFADAVEAVAADLTRLHIRRGDRVLFASENSVALSAFVFACSKLDAWPVVVNPRLSPREIDQINVHSGARRFFIIIGLSKEAAEHASRMTAELACRSAPAKSANCTVRGPNVMLGHYRAPELTAKAIDAEGWFNTGDLARLDGDHLFIAGRTKELIIRSGFNIYPAEVEAVLNSHEMVVQSAVIGRAVGGNEEVVACVQLLPGAAIEPDELMRYAAAQLTSTGKILKHKLWEAAQAAQAGAAALPKQVRVLA
jgi:acyl-CoA synthetase (AMP-forming)/AMP-acid ligase II